MLGTILTTIASSGACSLPSYLVLLLSVRSSFLRAPSSFVALAARQRARCMQAVDLWQSICFSRHGSQQAHQVELLLPCAVAVSAGRRSGVLIVDVAKIPTPLVRKGTEFYLDMGDTVYTQVQELVKMGNASRPRK